MFKAVIVEDEKPILDLMKYVIGQNPHYTILGAFSNPTEALAHLPHLQPDIVFLDVEMPRMNGLELARKVNEIMEQTKIVFTTAYKQYALDAFQVYAFDYILKPVTPASIDRIANRLFKQQTPAGLMKKTEQYASIRCLGGFEVRDPKGELIHWTTRKTEELFAFFLCHPGEDIGKWHLTELLWPEMDMERASHNLHNTMYRLKKLLKEHEIGCDIQKTNGGYMLEEPPFAYDVLKFQRFDFRRDERLWDVLEAEHLLSLYKGPLLEGKDYIWRAPLEETYTKRYSSLAHWLIQHDCARQDWKKAEQRLDVFLAIYPLHEEMNWLLLHVYGHSGNTEKLKKHYVKFETMYRRELGVDPPLEIRSWMSSRF